jgi:hypothetical protein
MRQLSCLPCWKIAFIRKCLILCVVRAFTLLEILIGQREYAQRRSNTWHCCQALCDMIYYILTRRVYWRSWQRFWMTLNVRWGRRQLSQGMTWWHFQSFIYSLWITGQTGQFRCKLVHPAPKLIIFGQVQIQRVGTIILWVGRITGSSRYTLARAKLPT